MGDRFAQAKHTGAFQLTRYHVGRAFSSMSRERHCEICVPYGMFLDYRGFKNILEMEMKIYRSSGARWRWQSRCLRVNFIAKTPTWTRICASHSPTLFPSAPSAWFPPTNRVLSTFTWLPALLRPLPEISSINLFYGEIPPDRARLHFSASSLRPINSTGSFDFVPHIWRGLLKFSRTLVRSLNLDFAKITGEIAYVTSHIEKRKRLFMVTYFSGYALTEKVVKFY